MNHSAVGSSRFALVLSPFKSCLLQCVVLSAMRTQLHLRHHDTEGCLVCAGGAGTTAAGLLAACPTTVVPFFGDQPFWGEACRRAGVGPKPIPIDSLNKSKLVSALKFMGKPEVPDSLPSTESLQSVTELGMTGSSCIC